MMVLSFEEETEKYLRRYNEFLENKTSKQLEKEEPRVEYKNVINYSVKLENRYPDYTYIDVVLYIRGYCLAEMGRISDSIQTFERMIAIRPDSHYIAEAYMLIAEYHYTKANFEEAIKFFNKVLPYKTEKYYKKVLFRLGQIYFVKKNYLKSLSSHIEFLDICKNEKQDELIGEMYVSSLNQIAQIFYEQYETLNIVKYFKNIGDRDYQFEIFEKLGQIFEDSGKMAGAKSIYMTMLQIFPLHKNVAFINDKLIALYDAAGETANAIKEREIMSLRFTQGSSWRVHNKQEADIITRIEALTENYLLEIAGYYYQSGIKLGREDDFKKAIKLYMLYLSKYRQATQNLISKINLNIADINYRIKQEKEAELFYNNAIRRDCRSDINGMAFLGLIKLYNGQIGVSEINEKKEYLMSDVKYKLSGKQEFNESYKNLLQSIEGYEKYALDQERACLVRITKGEIYYKHNHYDKARGYLNNVFNDCSSMAFKKASANMLLGSYVFEKNWPKIRKWSNELTLLGGHNHFLFLTGEKLVAEDMFAAAEKMEKELLAFY